MPSPFPGMDPYIESSDRWGDFHGSMAAEIRGELNDRLPERYVAEIELYVWVEEPAGRGTRSLKPDVFVTEQEGSALSSASVAVAAPLTIVLPRGQRKKRKHLRVIDRESNRVVTVIELLSPSNKAAGNDRDAYLLKRNDYLANGVSLVEVDLLRAGTRLPLSAPPPEILDFYVMVCRAWEFPRAGFWTFTLRDPIPDIPIPLAADVPDVLLPLRPCVDRAYDKGRYRGRLPYDRPLKPRLSRQDSAWVRELLTSRAER